MSMTEKEFNDKDERAAWELLGRHKPIEPSFGFVERTLRRLDETPAARDLSPWRWLVRHWAAGASFAVVLAFAGWLSWQHLHVKHRVDDLALAQQDYLEDFDVIASLDQINGGNRL